MIRIRMQLHLPFATVPGTDIVGTERELAIHSGCHFDITNAKNAAEII
jgi:hypothetical protein